MLIRQIYSDITTSISEFKKDPMAVMKEAEGFPVAVLNRNQAVFYCISAEVYEQLMDKLEDMELAEIVRQRQDSPEVEVFLGD